MSQQRSLYIVKLQIHPLIRKTSEKARVNRKED